MLQKLVDSGWFKGRKIDENKYTQYLINSKYSVLKNAVLFNQEFGELSPITTDYDCKIIFNVNYSLYDKFVLDNNLKNKQIAPVLLFFSPVWKLNLILIDENGSFYFNCGTKIADNAMDLWGKLLNEFIEFPIDKSIFTILQKSGWYSNRIINDKLLQEFKNKALINGYTYHNYSVDFFQEFGDLTIKLNNNMTFSTRLKSNPLIFFYNNIIANNRNNVPVGILEGFPVFVNEDGKFYYEGKFLGYTALQMFQSINS